MEERSNLVRGLSLAELGESKRMQIIQKDVQRRFEDRWMRAHKESLLRRQGEDFLRMRTTAREEEPMNKMQVAELEWILSTIDTMPVEDRIRLERRLQTKIRDCEEQLRCLVGLPPLYKKPLKRQRINAEGGQKIRLLSQFTKEGILSKLNTRLSKESSVGGNSIVLKQSGFLTERTQYKENKERATPLEVVRESSRSQFFGLQLPKIQLGNRESLALTATTPDKMMQQFAKDVLAIRERVNHLQSNYEFKNPLKVDNGEKKRKNKKRIPVDERKPAEIIPKRKLIYAKPQNNMKLWGFNHWRKPLIQVPLEASAINLSKSQEHDNPCTTDRDHKHLYEALLRYQQICTDRKPLDHPAINCKSGPPLTEEYRTKRIRTGM